MAAPVNKKKKCNTYIPKEWARFTGPAYHDGMSVEDAQKLWFAFLRVHTQVHPNPPVYGKITDK